MTMLERKESRRQFADLFDWAEILPDGADESAVAATYKDGILEVSVPVTAKAAEARAIPIDHTS